MVVIAIIGGGISGLSAAYYLSKSSALQIKNSKIILLESSSRLGGCIESIKCNDGAVFEWGPHSIRSGGVAGANTLRLLEDLTLYDGLLPIPRAHPAASKRYLYVNQQLNPLPTSFFSIFKRIPPFSRTFFFFGKRDILTKRQKIDDESVYDFFVRRFGRGVFYQTNEVSDYMADALCRGIFAGDCRKLSMRACFPSIFEQEQKYGSVVLGMILSAKDKIPPELHSVHYKRSLRERWSIWTLAEGLQQLPDTLGNVLQKSGKVEIHTNSPCTSLEFINNKVKIQCGRKEHVVDHVISCIPASNLAPLLQHQQPELANKLASISQVSVAVVNLEYAGDVLVSPGFGHLVPSTEPSSILGIIYDSAVFPTQNRRDRATTRLTCMMGGAWFDELFGSVEKCSAEELTKTAVEAVRKQLDVHSMPIRTLCKIQKNCIPQYQVGHVQLVNEIFSLSSRLPLTLIGASYNGVSVNDCIYNSRLAVEKLINSLQSNS